MLLREPDWRVARAIVDATDVVSTSRLTYVEAYALLAAARRTGRLSRGGLARAHAALERVWREVDVIELRPRFAGTAAQAAAQHGLRALDAVHFASAAALGPDVVVATWDEELRRAAREAGLAVAPA